MLRTAVNPWGLEADEGGLEAQRSDLWHLTLENVVDRLRGIDSALFASVGLRKESLPEAGATVFYPTQVSVPPSSTAGLKITRGTVPRFMPGYAEPFDPVRVDFLHETHNPAIFTVLKMWQHLGRLGRVGGESSLLLPHAAFKPAFRFDVRLWLLTGSDNGAGLLFGAQYLLAKCWPMGLQSSQLDRSGKANTHIITVQLQAQEILS